MLFRAFGVLEVSGPAEPLTFPPEKPRRLLSMLLLRANRWVPDGELIDAIWPAEAPASATGNLRSYVCLVRRMLGPIDTSVDRIERRCGAYRIVVAPDELDTMIFEALIERGCVALDDGRVDDAVGRLTEALHLWRGDPYGSLETEAARAEVARLTEVRWSARRALADAHLAAGDVDRAVSLLRAMTAEDPLQEQCWRRLMTVLHDNGHRAQALTVYHDVCQVIADELGIEPGAEIRSLHERILRDETPVRLRVETSAEPGSAVAVAEPSADRRPRPSMLLAGALVLVAALVAVLTLADRTTPPPVAEQAPAVPTTAAERHGWGTPRSRAEFGGGLDEGWAAAGPRIDPAGFGRVMPNRVQVGDGVLTITALAAGDTGTLARTDGSMYGRWEARVRVPPGCACYRPVLSLSPVVGDTATGGEVVFLESFDTGRTSADFFLASRVLQERLHNRREVDLTVWNTFAVEWTRDHVSGYVNGELWFVTEDRSVLPARPMRPSVTLELVSTDQVTGASIDVDWIREYPVPGNIH